MKIKHYLRFKVSESDKRIYFLFKKYTSDDTESINFNNSIELHLEPDPDDEVYLLYSEDDDIATIYFIEDKYCYGHMEYSDDLIIGKRILKKSVIDIIVFKDQNEYLTVHYQALKNGAYNNLLKDIKRML